MRGNSPIPRCFRQKKTKRVNIKPMNRGSGGAVVNVYAREAAAAAVAPAPVPVVDGTASAAAGGLAVRAPLRRNDYAPLAAWRGLRYIDGEGREAAASYNRMRVRCWVLAGLLVAWWADRYTCLDLYLVSDSPRVLATFKPQNESRYLVVLAGMGPEGLVLDGLKRMRIVPPKLASVVGVCPTPPHEAVRLVKKHGLHPGQFLSDVDGRWLAAHGVGGPRALRPLMLVLDGARGVVLSVVSSPAPGSVNDLLAEAVGDWRGGNA